VITYYNGFYNAPPCVNETTRLADVEVVWNASNTTHRYDDENDTGFPGFVACLLNGTDETLGIGVDEVSAWGVRESMALDGGVPDLAGHTVDFIQLVVEDLSRTGSAPDYSVSIAMRWLFFGS